MKKLIYTMTVSCLFFGLGSCDQEIDYPYEGKDRIYFDCFTFNSYTRIRTYTDSLTFSFGLIADSIRIDTARIVLHYSGNASEQERIYHVKVVQDSTTAEEGIHYQPIQKEQVFRPGRLTDTLKIVVLRDHMNSRFLDKERYRLELELEPSEDFDLGIRQGIRKTLWLNNYMSEPVWWEGNFHGRLGFFHPEKWKILINWDKEFANQDKCKYDQNNRGQDYYNTLRSYIKNDANAVYDEDGHRVYFDHVEVPEEE